MGKAASFFVLSIQTIMPVEMVGVEIGLSRGETQTAGGTLDASVNSLDNLVVTSGENQVDFANKNRAKAIFF